MHPGASRLDQYLRSGMLVRRPTDQRAAQAYDDDNALFVHCLPAYTHTLPETKPDLNLKSKWSLCSVMNSE